MGAWQTDWVGEPIVQSTETRTWTGQGNAGGRRERAAERARQRNRQRPGNAQRERDWDEE